MNKEELLELADLLEKFAASDLMDYPSDEDRQIQTALDIVNYCWEYKWTALYPSTPEVAHGGWPRTSKTEATLTIS